MALIRAELAALRAEVARLAPGPRGVPAREQPLQVASVGARERIAAERVALFRLLFVGRHDMYAQRWEKDGAGAGTRNWNDSRARRGRKPKTPAGTDR